VVFSSFNNIAKLNAETMRTWGIILAAVPGSRLALKSSALNFPDTVDRLLDACERGGIDPARVELRGWVADRRQHLELYGGIDIALDTLPYNGTTTTCEALWMGAPVITLAGEVHMSRVGATILRSAGLSDLVARDAADYANIAIALAADPARRKLLRAGMRARLAASPLLDDAGFTRKLEAHCRRAWGDWCGLNRGA
jgi:predicted O-linked N-acetylglucosamine transferase (SPINDLY family)